jgi:hypothetical protein
MACSSSGLKVPNVLPMDRWPERVQRKHPRPAATFQIPASTCPMAPKTFSSTAVMRHPGSHLLPTLIVSALFWLLFSALWLLSKLFSS